MINTMNHVAPQFGNLNLPDVNSYAKPAESNGTSFLRMMVTQPEGFPHPWGFAHREKGKGAVHALSIVNTNGKKNVLLVVQNRATFGGKIPVISLPAGLFGDEDPNETAKKAGGKELQQELGYVASSSKPLASNGFATSAGMTTERKWFFQITADGDKQATDLDGSEKAANVRPMLLPLETFENRSKFVAWLFEQEEKGYLVEMDVIAARGLYADGGKLNLTA